MTTGLRRVAGLMTGTSLDGVDAAVIVTDGERVAERRGGLMIPFSAEDRDTLLRAVKAGLAWAFEGPEPNVFAEAEGVLMRTCADAVRAAAEIAGCGVDLVGFHGQTVVHRPPTAERLGATRQIGDAQALADALKRPVAFDFRSADVEAGGQGAPLAPIYHRALLASAGLAPPLAVLNLGGVANLTWWDGADTLIGFDCGAANGPLDAFVEARTGAAFDQDGRLARQGLIDPTVLAALMAHPHFERAYPKSLDRWAFDVRGVEALTTADGAATLTAFVVEGVARGLAQLPAPPTALVVAGGGARNLAIMAGLRARLTCGVLDASALGWSGDLLEAELFAYLAARVEPGLPISFPLTTGAPRPLPGGRIVQPRP